MTPAESLPERIDLRRLFLGLQDELALRLTTNRALITHPGTKGDVAELNWRSMLESYLPGRYQVTKAFVLDADGVRSEQMDIVIHDRYYSPLLFNQDGAIFVPAESVYAVMEVKQELSREMVEYAAGKAASVRRLRRTSAPFPYVGGTSDPREPFPILAGLLCLQSTWSPPLGEPLLKALGETPEAGRLDLLCAVQHGSVEVTYDADGVPSVESSASDAALVFLFLRLMERLRAAGNVPAIDLRAYGRSITGQA